jgi:hypothetical protein
MHQCPSCQSELTVERLRCPACGLHYGGTFALPRLARLTPEQQDLAERILLAAGNLKEVAAALEVSYPTLRKRLDAMITALAALREADAAETRRLLDAVEAGGLRAEEAARLIREMSGGR